MSNYFKTKGREVKCKIEESETLLKVRDYVEKRVKSKTRRVERSTKSLGKKKDVTELA